MNIKKPLSNTRSLSYLSEDDQINLSRLSKLVAACKRSRDTIKQEEIIYESLPLFNEIFRSSTFQEIFEFFPDVHVFCAHISSLFVKEIKIRAIDQTSEEGSKLIAAFLENGLAVCASHIESEPSSSGSFESLSKGSLLLITLEKLSCSASLIECMSAAGVPSTLVKCLYIFLDLPADQNTNQSKDRIHLQYKFTQFLQQICISSVAAEELVNADALRHLFSASVDPCPPSHSYWRKSSCTILTTLAQNCLSPLVLQYIHDSGCLSECIENLQQMRLPKQDVLEVFNSLFHILSESSMTSSQLLDDFLIGTGYTAIIKYLLTWEIEETEEAQGLCQRLTKLLGGLVFIGDYKEARSKPGAIVDMFQLPGFRGNLTMAKGEAVRNIHAVDALQSVFIRARTSLLCTSVLERVKDIYERSPGNYFMLDKHHLISSIAEGLSSKPTDVQEYFFFVFAFMVERMCYVPIQELSSVSLLLRDCKSSTCVHYAVSCLLRLVLKFPTLREFYRNVEILDMIVLHLEKCVETLFKFPPRRCSVLPQQKEDEKMRPLTSAETSNSSCSSSSLTYIIVNSSGSEEADIGKAERNHRENLFVLTMAIIRLLSATIATSLPDVELFTKLGGTRCLLTRLLPACNLPLLVPLAKETLDLLEKVFVVAISEDQLLDLLNVLPVVSIRLRFEILRLLCRVLRDSRRCRHLFRKCNCCIHVVQEIVRLVGSLSTIDAVTSSEAESSNDNERGNTTRQVIGLVKAAFACLTIAMKYEPANAHQFTTEKRFESLEEALRLLGCFTKETMLLTGQRTLSKCDDVVDSSSRSSFVADKTYMQAFRLIFLQPQLIEREVGIDEGDAKQLIDVPNFLIHACLIFRYLTDMALDTFDKSSVEPDLIFSPPPFAPTGSALKSPESSFSSQLRFFASTPSIVHTGAILTILRLIPAIDPTSSSHPVTSKAVFALQTFGLQLVKAVMESERSQQLLCDAGMPEILLTNFRQPLASSSDAFHTPVSLLFTLLASHSLTSRDFRNFLRLSGSFCEHMQLQGRCAQTLSQRSSCLLADSQADNNNNNNNNQLVQGSSRGLDKMSSDGECNSKLLELFALSSITQLLEDIVCRQRTGACVRESSSCARGSIILPPFVEFDMSIEGFGCLFIPSLAPQRLVQPANSNPLTTGVAYPSSEVVCVGGVGSGERIFPPAAGITFCSWVCVEEFGALDTPMGAEGASARSLPHPVRLFTVLRGVQGTNDQIICLAVTLDPISRSLVVSSRERLLTPIDAVSRKLSDTSSPPIDDAYSAVFRTQNPRLSNGFPWSINTWHHIALVFNRASVMKHSSCTFHLDGHLMGSQKLLFPPPGSGSITTSVCAFIGTQISQRQLCPLRWRQGPFQLIEESLTAGQVALIATLGPEYIGSFQAPPAPPNGEDCLQPLFAEEKLSFAAFSSSSITATISRIRKIYSPTDAALIAKVLHMPQRENVTPIRVLRNIASELAGPSRSLGAVLVGYQGIRLFTPRPLATLLESVANPAGLLISFIALAHSRDQLKNSLWAVFCVINSNLTTAAEIKRVQGYQLIANILRKKNHFLDEEIINMVVKLTLGQLVSADNRIPEGPIRILNEEAFCDLLCDLKLWTQRTKSKLANSSSANSTDYGLVAYLVDQLASQLQGMCGEGSVTILRSKSLVGERNDEELNILPPMNGSTSSIVSRHLFDGLLFLLMDAVGEVTNHLLTDAASSSPAEVSNHLEAIHLADLIASVMRAVGIVLVTHPSPQVLHLFSRLLIWTLPKQPANSHQIPDENEVNVAQERSILIFLRNHCLLLLSHLLSQPKAICGRLCDQFCAVLGFDWFLLFLSPSVHDTSAAHALRCFCLTMLTFGSSRSLNLQAGPSSDFEFVLAKSEFPGPISFREDAFVGGWMNGSKDAHPPDSTAVPFAANRFQCISELSLSSRQKDEPGNRINGFLALSALLVNNAHMPEVYMMLVHLLLGIRTPCDSPSGFDFDELYNHLSHSVTYANGSPLCSHTTEVIPKTAFFLAKISLNLQMSTSLMSPRACPSLSTPPAHLVHTSKLFSTIACPEAATVIISIFSALIRSFSQASDEKKIVRNVNICFADQKRIVNIPIVMLQFFIYLYQSNSAFQAVALSPEFLTGLIDLLVIGRFQQTYSATASVTSNTNITAEFAWSRLDELLLGFIRTIVTDSFCLPLSAHRPVHVIDTILEAEQSSCSSRQHHELQTLLMRQLMDYLLAKDILTDPGQLLPQAGSFVNIPYNVAYFACKLVDKLWQGCFLGTVSEIIDFVSQLIHLQHSSLSGGGSPLRHCQVNDSVDLGISRASLYRSLNRACLFQLSRPILSQKDQRLALNLLNLLLLSDDDEPSAMGAAPLKGIVFSPFNQDAEFPVCLAHLLIQHVHRNRVELKPVVVERGKSIISETLHISTTSSSASPKQEMEEVGFYRTVFDFDEEDSEMEPEEEEEEKEVCDDVVISSTSENPEITPIDADLPAQPEEFEQLSRLAMKLWDHCYMWNQKIFIALLPNSPLASLVGIPLLLEWSQELEGPCLTGWIDYIGSEASGCGGLLGPGESSKWGFLSLYSSNASGAAGCESRSMGPVDRHQRGPGFTNNHNNNNTSASTGSSTGRLSHQLSRKFTWMSASVLRMASTAVSSSPSSGSIVPTTEIPSAHKSSLQHRAFSLVDDLGGGFTGASTRIPFDLPLLTKRSATISTLKRIGARLKNPITLITESLECGKQHQERHLAFIYRQVEIEWNKLESELTQEHSIWGPLCPDDLAKWELDLTEGPCRMRKRMLPNHSFYRHYPNAPDCLLQPSADGSHTTGKQSFKVPLSLDSGLHHHRHHLRYLLESEPRRNEDEDKKLNDEDLNTGEVDLIVNVEDTSIEDVDEDLGFVDLRATEESLLRTSRLLRDNKGRQSLSSQQNKLVEHVIEEEQEGGDGECGAEYVEEKKTENEQHHFCDDSSPTQNSPTEKQHPTKDAEASLSEEPLPAMPSPSTGALDQLTGHIAFMRLLEPEERLFSIYRCARICGLDVHEGLLLFGRSHFYVIDGYTLMNTHEIVDIEALPPSMQHEPIVPTTTSNSTLKRNRKSSACSTSQTPSFASNLVSSGAVDQISGNQYFKFAYEKIREVHRRRYLLQQTALEVFNADGRNFLLVFAKDLQRKVYDCFSAVSSSINANKFNTRTSSNFLSSLLGEKTVTQRWVRGEISNFQYLMYVNTQAGRSYNDLMQYPVFPWVLADYTSDELDLTRPSTFRDLSKPMGAQTPTRLVQFQRRFWEWDDPTGETPPYHYGTHYSSAMIVVSYLVRMEPFAQHFIKLQGGHFDLADRMFHSVGEAWHSASQHNMADVRELVPEFFYLPDFLVNSNRFDIGCKQNGVRVDDVVLPPWAKGDPREFIRKHREALESEYVSANLHNWINLIFGFKQQGDAAVQSVNVFHHLFYEGNVDIYAIDDPVKRRAVIGFINNFGQIPRQIFTKPHAAKKTLDLSPTTGCSGDTNISSLFFHNLDILKPSMGSIKELRHAVGQIMQLDPSNLKGFSSSSTASGSTSMHQQQQAGGLSAFILPGGIFGSAGIGVSSNQLEGIGPIVVVEQNKVLLPPTYTRYLAWGFPDDSFRICSLADGRDRLLQVFEGVNSSQVLCAAAPNASTIVTAGLNCVVKVWQLRNPTTETSKPFCPMTTNNSNTPGAHGGDLASTVGSFMTTPNSLRLSGSLYGHTDVVTCLAASDSFNLIVSGSRDCTCLLWDLRYLIFLRQLGGSDGAVDGGYRAPVAAVCISEATGDVAVCSGAYLHLWSISGELIACINTAPDQSYQIYCVSMSTLRDWDPGHVIITGGSDGVLRMWGLNYVREKSSGNDGDDSDPHTRIFKVQSSDGTSWDSDNQVKWRRELNLSAELTMQSAFSRSGGNSSQPSALTAIAVSRDHGSVLVGDMRGRVFAWSVPVQRRNHQQGGSNEAGGSTDHWVRDDAVQICASSACGTRFSITERRHHCRNCGKVFCSRCSRFESEIHRFRIFRPVRVCTDCFALLKDQQNPSPSTSRLSSHV